MFEQIGAQIGSAILGEAMRDEGGSGDSVAKQQSDQANLQREFAQNGIRWRVADAKAAGLHPVFALGGNVATYSPQAIVSPDVSTGDFSSMGQHLGRAMSAQQSAHERAITDLQLRQGEAAVRKDEAIASYYASEAARNAQAAVVSAPVQADPISPSVPPAGVVDGSVKVDPASYVPHRVGDVSMEPPQNPMWGEFSHRGGVPIALPSRSASEALESVSESWPLTAWVVAENVKRYGSDWLRAMWEGTVMPAAKPPRRGWNDIQDAWNNVRGRYGRRSR